MWEDWLYQILGFIIMPHLLRDFPGASVIKNLPANAGDSGDAGLFPGLGRSPGVGNGNPLQYSCLDPRTEEPGRLQSRGSQGLRHD